MCNFTNTIFYFTTAEDQLNYFTGDTYSKQVSILGENKKLSAGNYRVIDGKLLPIFSGYTQNKLRDKFNKIANNSFFQK